MRTTIYFILLGLSVTNFAQSTGKQSLAQLEESPAGSKILWFVDAIKSGDAVSETDIRKYFSPKLIEKMGVDELKMAFDEIQEVDGALFIYEADRVEMTKYKLKLKGKKSGEWLAMQFFFEDSNPYKMLGFTLDSADGSIESGDPIYPKLD